jgi:hypothetical protein
MAPQPGAEARVSAAPSAQSRDDFDGEEDVLELWMPPLQLHQSLSSHHVEKLGS